MKSSEDRQGEISNTTNVIRTSNLPILPIKQNPYLIHHISKFEPDHDVTNSSKMIKVTYKKSSRDHLMSPNYVNGMLYSNESVPNSMNIINSVNELEVYKDQGKTPIKNQVASNKSENNCSSFTISRKKASILVGCSSTHQILHPTSKKDLVMEDLKNKESINGLTLLQKFESLKEISGIKSNLKSPLTLKPKSPATQISLPSKSVQIRASTSGKFQGSPPTIKIPKGITIIRVKGNTITKNEEVLKKATSDKIILPQSKKKQNLNVKRKLPISDSLTSAKVMKKCETSSQMLKSNKQLKNYSDITDLCETIISEDISENSMYSNSTNIGKKEILMEDPDLPKGWKRVVHTRYEGTPFAKHVVYIYSPQGKKFQFKWKLRRYLEKIKSPLSAEQFHFGLYKKTKPSLVLPIKEIKNGTFISEKTSGLDVTAQIPSAISRNLIVTKAKAFNLKHSSSVSRNLGKSRLSHSKTKVELKNSQGWQNTTTTLCGSGHSSSSHTKNQLSNCAGFDKQKLLLYDPDLPFGWKRVINSKSPNGKLQVNIISPEGRIFRRRYRLHQYLTTHQYSYSIDQFYFGLYPKKYFSTLEEEASSEGKTQKLDDECKEDDEDSDHDNSDELILSETDMSKFAQYATPMYEDPNLPEGWTRFIKIRACGRNAGKMEVVIVSPEGKRIRSKAQLQNYFQKNNLSLNANDFNFSVFGHPRKRSHLTEFKESVNAIKRRSSDRPVPDFDINEVKETKITPEGEIINKVSGIMISCGLSSERSERRLRMPRKEHEQNLKTYMSSLNDTGFEDGSILSSWIQKLVKCRSDFRNLEPDAVMTIANSTREFIKELSLHALQDSDNAKNDLRYEDIANIVDKYENLSYLKALIPKKITYKEYVKLNRPKQFLSFT